MKFGKSWDEVQTEPTTSGGGYIKYFKEDSTTLRLLQEPKDWIGYWEHFNPGGFPFPCTGDRKSCPGCTSDNEKMNKAGRKIAINVLENGEQVSVYKFPKTLADKLSNRANRIGTVTDRDYLIFKIRSKNSDGSVKVDYDLEGQEKIPVDVSKLELHDVEQMLSDAYEQSWGSSDVAKQTTQKNEDAAATEALKAKLAAQEAAQDEKPPFSQPSTESDPTVEGAGNSYTEDDLRAMDKSGILAVCDKEGLVVPSEIQDRKVTQIVDWLLEQ